MGDRVEPPIKPLAYICCRCGFHPTAREPDGWLPGVGAVCAEHALEHWAAQQEEAEK